MDSLVGDDERKEVNDSMVVRVRGDASREKRSRPGRTERNASSRCNQGSPGDRERSSDHSSMRSRNSTRTSSRINVDQLSEFSENLGTLPEKRSRSRSSCKIPSRNCKPGGKVYSRSKSVVGSSKARFKPLHGILKPSGRSMEKHNMKVRFLDTTNFEDALGSSEMMKETAYETKRAEVAIIQKKIDELKKEKEKIRKERDMLERNNPETINSVKSGVGEIIRKEKKPKKDKKIKKERAEKEKNTDQNKNKKIKGPGDKIRKQMRRIETMELMEWGLSFKMPASTSSHIQEVSSTKPASVFSPEGSEETMVTCDVSTELKVSSTKPASVLSPQGSKESMVTCAVSTELKVSETKQATVLSPQGVEEGKNTSDQVSYVLKDELSNIESDESSRVERESLFPCPRIVEDMIDHSQDVLETGEELRSRFFREIQAELDQAAEWNYQTSVLKSLLAAAGVGQSNSEVKIDISDTVPVENNEIENHDQIDQVGHVQIQGSHQDLNAQPEPDFCCPGIGLGSREHASLNSRVLADLDQEGILLREFLDIGFYSEISTVVPDNVQVLTPSSPVFQDENEPAPPLSSPVLLDENEPASTLFLQVLREENEPAPMEFSPFAPVTTRSPEPGFYYWNSQDEISPVVTSVLQKSIGGCVSLLDRNSFDLSHVEELSQGNQKSFSTVETLDTPRMKDHLIEVLKSLGVSDAEFEQNLETRIAPCDGFQQNLETDLAPSTELQYPNNKRDLYSVFQQNSEINLASHPEYQQNPKINRASHLEYQKYPDADLAPSTEVLKIPKTNKFLHNTEYGLAPCLESIVTSCAKPRQNLKIKQSIQNPDTELTPRPQFQEIVETEFAPCPEFQQNPTKVLAPSLEFQKILKTEVSSHPEFPQNIKPNDASHPESWQKPEIKLAPCPVLQKTPETKLFPCSECPQDPISNLAPLSDFSQNSAINLALVYEFQEKPGTEFASCPQFQQDPAIKLAPSSEINETSETKVAPCPNSKYNPKTRVSLLELQEIPEIKFSLHLESQQNLITELASSPELQKTPELHQTPVIEVGPSPEIQLVLNTKLGSKTDAVSDTKVNEINTSHDAENNLPVKQLLELEPKPATSLILETKDTLSNYSKTELFTHTETKIILDTENSSRNNTIPKTPPNTETSIILDTENASRYNTIPETFSNTETSLVLDTENASSNNTILKTPPNTETSLVLDTENASRNNTIPKTPPNTETSLILDTENASRYNTIPKTPPNTETSLILDTKNASSNNTIPKTPPNTETSLILDTENASRYNTIPETFSNTETSFILDTKDASNTELFPNTEIIGRKYLEPVIKNEDLPDLQEKDKSSLHRILSLYRTRMRRDSVNYQNVFNLAEISDEKDESEKTSSESESDSSSSDPDSSSSDSDSFSSDSDLPTGNEIIEMNMVKVGNKPELPVSKSRNNDCKLARKSQDRCIGYEEFKERLEVSEGCRSIEKKRQCDNSTNITSKGGEMVREVYKYPMFPGTPIPVIQLSESLNQPNPFSSVSGYIIPTILSTSTGYPCISKPATSTGYPCISKPATSTGYPCISKPATPTGYSCSSSIYPSAPIADAGKGFVSTVSSQKLFDFCVPPPTLNEAFVSPYLGKLTKTQDFINPGDYSILHPNPHQFHNQNMNLKDHNPVMETKHILNQRRCEELDKSYDFTSETGQSCADVYSNEGWKNDQRVRETWQKYKGRRQYNNQEDITSWDTRSNYNHTGRNKNLRDYLDQCPNPQWDRNYSQGSQYGLKNRSSERSLEGWKYPSRYSYSLERSCIKRARYSNH